MTIQIWFLISLICAFLLIQLIRLVDGKTPNELKFSNWVIIFISTICYPIGIILCFIGTYIWIIEGMKRKPFKINIPDPFKNLINFLLKERKL